MRLVKKYSEFDEITTPMLNEFIDRVENEKTATNAAVFPVQ